MRIGRIDFTALNKGKIRIDFSLQCMQMIILVGPIEMIRDRQDHVPTVSVDTYEIDALCVIHCHQMSPGRRIRTIVGGIIVPRG
jgi:hypothetical protein